MKNQLNSLQSKIPDYWISELDSDTKKINTALCDAGMKKSAFLFYTDVHWNYGSQISPLLLQYLYNNTGITQTIFGGDIVNDEGADYKTMSYLWEWRSMIKNLPDHHSVVGNHDDGNATNNLFSDEYIYGYLIAPEESSDMVMGETGFYYYIDNPLEKTRYLYLDTAYKGVDDKQLEFVRDALMSTKNGWHIIVIAHIWYLPDYENYNVRPVPIAGMDKNAEKIAVVLDDYNARENGFEECEAHVELCIGGHIHYDYVSTTEGGIPIIMVETDSMHIRGEYQYTSGTVSEAAVNGIVVDYNANKITAVRVGRGSSFEVDISTGEMKLITDEEDSGDTNLLDSVGYYENMRLGSSDGGDRVCEGFYTTGYIPVDISTETMIYLKNIEMPDSEEDYYNRVAYYDADMNYIDGSCYPRTTAICGEAHKLAWDENGNLTQFKIGYKDVAYIRITAKLISEESIITVNSPIS